MGSLMTTESHFYFYLLNKTERLPMR
uniref:Uncharacterized protein n=1 Tax=Anguilla anguilla TaxID=7936 RepID=A0A0E9SIV7_ANGAN